MPHSKEADSCHSQMDKFKTGPKAISFQTNFFRFKMKGRAKEVIFKYDVKFSPEVEQRHQKKRISIFAKARSEIKKTYELVVYEGDGVKGKSYLK